MNLIDLEDDDLEIDFDDEDDDDDKIEDLEDGDVEDLEDVEDEEEDDEDDEKPSKSEDLLKLQSKLQKSIRELEDLRSDVQTTFTSTDTLSSTINSLRGMLDALRVDSENLRESYSPKIEDWKILPQEALDSLKLYVDYEKPENKVEVVEDPKVDGTYALQIHRSQGKNKKPYVFHLLWYKGGYDEVDFDTFPPTSGDLKFF